MHRSVDVVELDMIFAVANSSVWHRGIRIAIAHVISAILLRVCLDIGGRLTNAVRHGSFHVTPGWRVRACGNLVFFAMLVVLYGGAGLIILWLWFVAVRDLVTR